MYTAPLFTMAGANARDMPLFTAPRTKSMPSNEASAASSTVRSSPRKGILLPAARAREELETRNGNIVFFQYVEHLAADRAGRAENGDIAVFHKRISFLSAGEPVIQYADRLFQNHSFPRPR